MGIDKMDNQHENLEYEEIEYILDDLYTARKEWQRAEWMTTPRVMARVGIDDALDAFNAYRAYEESLDITVDLSRGN